MSNILSGQKSRGADIFWNIPIEKMNDDRFGRSLDAFFEQRHSIIGAVALHVAEEFKVPLSELHYDPTHVLFEGAYDNAVKRDGVVGEAWNSAATRRSNPLTSQRAEAPTMRRRER